MFDLDSLSGVSVPPSLLLSADIQMLPHATNHAAHNQEAAPSLLIHWDLAILPLFGLASHLVSLVLVQPPIQTGLDELVFSLSV